MCDLSLEVHKLNNGAAETRDDDLLKQKEEEMIRYLTTLQSFIRENSNLSKKKSMNEIEGNSKETQIGRAHV